NHLIEQGVTPETRVGVYLDRSLGVIVALIAILKAGAAYVPFAADLPPRRRNELIAEAGIRCIITVGDYRDLFSNVEPQVVALDGDAAQIAGRPSGNPDLKLHPLSAAYVNYTSGSTGRPKGVLVPHAAILRLVGDPNYVTLDATLRLLQAAPLSFDAATFEIWGALLNGGTLVIMPPGLAAVEDIGAVIQRAQVNTIWLTAGLFDQMVTHALPNLAPVRQLLAGGDVLPPERVRQMLQAHPSCRVINGYGPTENTTFSACYPVPPDADLAFGVPIGFPVNNTRAYVLDPALQPVATGVFGELYVSGSGLARGYISQPGLTAERFVADPYADQPGARMYRTGDLVRWRPGGALEFAGRIDQQLKIRGFRVEPGEIEAVLRHHPRIADALVLTRELTGQKQLLAYVVSQPQAEEQARAHAAHLEAWQQLYDTIYNRDVEGDGGFNVVGWDSSYTGQPLAPEDMRIWVNETVAHLRSLRPTDVVEVGCGTGLLLTRLAATCQRYVGLDFSRVVLDRLSSHLATRSDFRHVELREGRAHELAFLADDSVDLVILNSVVQYFPDVDYLLDALAEAARVTRLGGHIFVGDVRSLPLLEAFHTSVELSKAPADLPLDDLRQRVQQALRQDRELVVDPALFHELVQRTPKLGRADVTLKSGYYDNELSRFRYDITLTVGPTEVVDAPAAWLTWDAAGCWRDALLQALTQAPEASIGVRAFKDRRTAASVQAVRLLQAPDAALATAADLRAACAQGEGEDPNTAIHLAARCGASLSWQGFDAEGVYAIVYNPPRAPHDALPTAPRSLYRRYTNAPIRLETEVALTRALQDHLRQSLPEYMVPAAIVVLDAWPLTPNGKIDRQALPVLERPTKAYRPPQTPAETLLCELVADVLALPRVGPADNFFALGGDSILSILLVSRGRRVGLELTPRDVFEQPTLSALAAVARVAGAASRAEASADTRFGEVVPTPIMRWWFERGGPIRSFNQSVFVRLPPDMIEADLTAALQALLDTHDALRMRLEHRSGEPLPRLHIPPPGGVAATDCLTHVDLTPLDEPRRLERMRQEASSAAGRLDPKGGRMLHAVWFTWNGEARLLLVIHHLSVDGVSWRILLPDLVAAWDAAVRGTTPRLDPIATPFRVWADYLHARAQTPARQAEAAFWESALSAAATILPGAELDPQRDTQTAAEALDLMLPADLSAALLTAVPAAFHSGINDVLLTALAVAIARWRPVDGAILIDVEGHGREPLDSGFDLSRTVGWFTSLFPIALNPAPVAPDDATGVARALQHVKEQLRAVPDRGLGYGLLRYLDGAAGGRLACLPAAQVGFNYLGRLGLTEADAWVPAPEGVQAPGDADSPLPHLLDINAVTLDGPQGPQLAARWTWAERVLGYADVRALADAWQQALAGLASHVASGGGGHTPSDLSLVSLTQAQIDQLDATTPDLETILPLTPLQEGLVFHALYDDTAPDIYTVQLVLELHGALDSSRLRIAAQALLMRHANLRASIRHVGLPRPVQVIVRDVAVPWRELDLSQVQGEQQHAQQEAWLADNRSRFILTEAPLLRFGLIRLSAERHLLVFTNHHVLLDGWSMPVLFRELLSLYSNGADARSLPRVTPYADYLAWLLAQDRQAALAAWQDYLADLDGPTLLAGPQAGAPSPVVPERWQCMISPALTARLLAFCRARGLTVNTVIQGAWAVMLARLTGRDDVTFGVTVSGRPAALQGVEQMVGLFINTVPLRVHLRWDQPFATQLAGVQDSQGRLLPHQHAELAAIQRAAGGDLFDTLVVFENFPFDRNAVMEAATDLRVAGLQARDATHYAFTLVASPGEQIHLRLDYDATRWDLSQVEALGTRLQRLLEAGVASPDAPLYRLDTLDPHERRRLLRSHPAPAVAPSVMTLPDLFEQQAMRTPDCVAIVFEHETFTYGALNAQANRLAHCLIEMGVGPESVVGLCLERSLELATALLAVVKTGAAYLPLDPDYPAARLTAMLANADPAVVLANTSRVTLPPTVNVFDPGSALDRYPTRNPTDRDRIASLQANHPAYVIYTSGSTGAPKGVAVTHRNVARLFHATRHWFNFGEQDVWTLFHSYAFDFSVWELWGALLHGGRLVVVPKRVAQSPDAFLALLVDQQVTVLNQTPSAFYQLVDADQQNPLLGDRLALRTVVFGGEALNPARLSPWYRRHADTAPSLVNMYGITETTVHVTYQPLDRRAAASIIGDAIPDLRAYVLDAALEPVPIGVCGEIYVAGAGLARGYRNRPELSAERFVADPHAVDPGARMYRTGDLARWRSYGELEYLGRSDLQVKVRGFRIELGEIEAALLAQPGVREAVVIARDGEADSRQLVAYIVPAAGSEPDALLLRRRLSERLPDYMLPAGIVVLASMPLTPSGKLDRRALPAPGPAQRNGDDLIEPQTETARMLAAIWSPILGVEHVGEDDNFFALGGHSLMATQVMSRVREVFDVTLPIRTLFDMPRLGSMARAVETAQQSPLERRPALQPMPRPAQLPLSWAQQRLWFINDLLGKSPEYHMPSALRLRGALDQPALERTINAIIERHESLRTHFATVDGQPVQVIEPVLRLQISPEPLDSLDEASQQDVVATAMRSEWETPFDLVHGPVLRVRLFRLAPLDQVLLITFHHIVSDGWSIGIFIREFVALYQAFRDGRDNPLDPLPIQYADFAIWQRGWLDDAAIDRGINYWKQQLGDVPDQLTLPADRPRPAVLTYAADVHHSTLAPAVVSELKAFSYTHQATLYMLLLTVYATLLQRYSGQDDLVIGSPIANRQDSKLEALIGFFVNALAMRVQIAPDATFASLLADVRRTTLDAYHHQDVPFERLVEELSPERRLNMSPLFQVWFALQNAPLQPQHISDLDVVPIGSGDLRVRFDIELHASERDGAVHLDWLYNRDLFDRPRIERMARHFQ
ncbi:MAG: amino acid adenylation domain-containing protein, partial [Rhodopila sp.]